MRRIVLGFLAGASALGLASVASAADLARPVYKAPPPPPPIFSWTGFYIGVNVGAGWGTKEYEQTVAIPIVGFPLLVADGSHTVNGGLAGGQIGYNWQAGWVVWGVEAQGDWANLRGKGNCGLVALWNCSTTVEGLATFAGRFGVVYDHTLVYVKGGAAWSRDRYNINLLGLNFPGIVQPSEISDNRWGWMVGTGVEVAVPGSLGWSAKVEYNYMDFGSRDYLFNTVPITAAIGLPGLLDHFNVTERIHLVKFGLNYRFNYGGPVVASY